MEATNDMRSSSAKRRPGQIVSSLLTTSLLSLVISRGDAFGVIAPRTAIAGNRPRMFTTTSLYVFATDVFVDNLSEVHYTATLGSSQTYLESLSMFATETSNELVARAGMGTATTANPDVLRASFDVTDDLMTRIAMAADFVPQVVDGTSGGGSMAAAAAAALDSVMTDAWETTAAAAAAGSSTTTMASDLLESATTAGTPLENGNAAAAAAAAMESTQSSPLMDTSNNALRSQLADLATSYTFDEPASRTSPFAGLSQALGEWGQSSQAALAGSQKGLSQALSSLGQGSQAAFTNLQSGTKVAATSGAHVFGGAKTAFTGVSHTASAVVNAPSQMMESTKANVKLVTSDLSVSQLAQSMAQGLVNLGKMIVMVLNIIVEAISGENLADIVGKAQTAATEVTASAVASIITTIHQIGDMTISEALTSIAKLVVLVTTVLYRIFSGILELISGKNAGEWGTLAAQNLEHQADQLLTAASSTATDLSHKSLTELVAMLSSFEQEAAHTVVTTATQVLESVDASSVALASLSALQ